MQKKILIISRAFYPTISPRSFRTTELAKEFARQGHEVTVCFPTGDYDYSSFEREYRLKVKNLGPMTLKGIKVKGGRLEQIVRKFFIRALKVLFEYPDIEFVYKVERFIRKETASYDLLISVAVPHMIHWGVSNTWKGNRKIARTWVADCGDPFMFARLDTFRKPFYFRYFEKKFCRRCDFISVPFDDMRNQFYEEFRLKIITIPQGIDFTRIRKFDGEICNNRPTFIFAGSVIPGYRDLSQLFGFLSKCEADFHFIIYTKQNPLFDRYGEQLNNRLELREYIERFDLIYELSKADFLVNIDTVHDKGTNIEAMPSKLIDYALSGRPILNIYSDNLDTGKVVAFLNGDYNQSRKIDLSRYDIKLVTRQFLEAADIKNRN